MVDSVLAVVSAAFVLAFVPGVACGGAVEGVGAPDAATDTAASSSASGAMSPCAQFGGICEPSTTENSACRNVDGSAYEYRGSIQGLCGSDSVAICCVRP